MATITIRSRLDLLEKQTKDNGEVLKKLDLALYGNGKPGLLTEFQLLREDVKRHHEQEEQKSKEKKTDWQWVITTLVAIAAIIVAIYKR